jgi:hypothetical protein
MWDKMMHKKAMARPSGALNGLDTAHVRALKAQNQHIALKR